MIARYKAGCEETTMQKRALQGSSAFLLLLAALLIAACAPVFPREVMDRVDHHLSFRDLQSNPDQFKGTWTMFGGEIIAVKNEQDGTSIEVLQKPLDSDGRPLDTDKSDGRFLIHTNQYLDAAVYQPGRPITIIGEVAGYKTMQIDEISYRYPLLDEKFIHLWKPSAGPHFFFGIGVSSHI
jgi:outer membrane lipoprotein